MNSLKQLETCGQSPVPLAAQSKAGQLQFPPQPLRLCLGGLGLVESCELTTLIERDGLKGVTSNPFDLRKGDRQDGEYANSRKQFQTEADDSISAIYEHLTTSTW